LRRTQQPAQRIGVKPLNGTRRTGLLITLKNNGQEYIGSNDPLLKSGATAPIIEREPSTFPEGISDQEQYLDYLYDNYFVVTERDESGPYQCNTKMDV
jgi:hypothetical protein